MEEWIGRSREAPLQNGKPGVLRPTWVWYWYPHCLAVYPSAMKEDFIFSEINMGMIITPLTVGL